MKALNHKYDVINESFDKGGGCVAVKLVRAKQEPHKQYTCKVLKKANARELQIYRTVSCMTHDVAPNLREIIEEPDAYCMITEHCGGGTLNAYLGAHEDQVRGIVKRCLQLVNTLHSRGIVHNDIKPENFVICNGDVIKVIDFGISWRLSEPHVGDSWGTPWYMAPERLSGVQTLKSDVWSIGVLTYQLLTGMLPFNDRYNAHAPNVYSIWRSVIRDEIKIDETKYSRPAVAFTKCLLERDPNLRPTTQEALQLPWMCF